MNKMGLIGAYSPKCCTTSTFSKKNFLWRCKQINPRALIAARSKNEKLEGKNNNELTCWRPLLVGCLYTYSYLFFVYLKFKNYHVLLALPGISIYYLLYTINYLWR